MAQQKTYTDEARKAADAVLKAFEDTASLPEKLANVVLSVGGRHADNYSWNNQFLVMIHGYTDAAGYKQWVNEYGRQVRKGERAFPILAPVKRTFTATETDAETGEERKVSRSYIVGWKGVAVFGLEQTDVVDSDRWQKRCSAQAEAQAAVEAEPLFAVAQALGLAVNANGHLYAWGAAGCYRPTRQEIELAVENAATWAHELCHAVDDRLGTLNQRYGQQPDNEIVAELGGAILLTAMGREHEADLGGCWEYIKGYSEGGDTLAAAMKLLNRTLDVVSLILRIYNDPTEAEGLGKAE